MSSVVIDASVWVAAVDQGDPAHSDSVAFLTSLARREIQIAVPMLARLEVACALTRRFHDAAAATAVCDAFFGAAFVHEMPIDAELIDRAVQTGTAHRLRGADALYLAVAEREGAPLVTLDRELRERAEGMAPAAWMTR